MNILGLPQTGAQSIDSLLNNTVAPNVTLTSRGKMVPDSQQLSPNFTQSLMHQQLSPNQQRNNNAPFSSQTNQSELSKFNQINLILYFLSSFRFSTKQLQCEW